MTRIEDDRSQGRKVSAESPPQILVHGKRRRMKWKFRGNNFEQNEQIGIRNIHELFLENFPEFNDLFPRDEEGKIVEDKRGEAQMFILDRVGKRERFDGVFGVTSRMRAVTPYFEGSYRKVIRKFLSSLGINFNEESTLDPKPLRNSRGDVLWRFSENTPQQSQDLGIRNIQGIFLENFPEFKELFPRGEDGKIAEDKIENAKKFILDRLRSYRVFLKVFTSPTIDRRYTPYFNGSHIVAIQKSFFPWGLKFERIEFGKSGRAEISLSNEALIPSRELAWIIGVLAGGGYSNPLDKRISLDSNDEEFVKAFRSTGERLFNRNALIRTKGGENNTRKLKGVVFQGKEIALTIGDLRGAEWPETIIEKHRWIIDNSNYLWGFIEGIFERNGNVSMSKNRIKGVFISTYHVRVANFLAEILVRAGIERPLIEYATRGREGIIGIRFYSSHDLKHFAENVRPKTPEKEKRLDAVRKMDRRNRHEPIAINSPKSEEEVIAEWIQLKELLGHIPNISEIRRLKAQGNTKYSVTVYSNWFGGGIFSKARDNLETISKDRQVIDRGQNVGSSSQKTQIFP